MGIGEESRELALHNQSIWQGIFDEANGIWQAAYDEEQTALGNQKSAEEAEAAATNVRNEAISFRDERKQDKLDADNRVPPALKTMNDEIARVDEEKISLERVVTILEGMLPPGDEANLDIDIIGRRLLSRTTTFLSSKYLILSIILFKKAMMIDNMLLVNIMTASPRLPRLPKILSMLKLL